MVVYSCEDFHRIDAIYASKSMKVAVKRAIAKVATSRLTLAELLGRGSFEHRD
jgi:hypothetical protein